MNNKLTTDQAWKSQFGASYFNGIGKPLVNTLALLDDTSYRHDDLPSFTLCSKRFDGDNYELRAWVGFDEDDEMKETFIFSLGLNVNEEYIWNYSSHVEALFSNVLSTCRLDSDNVHTNEQNIISLIMECQNKFPEVIADFIENELL